MEIENRAEWLKARRLGIGGSDIAGILGVSKYSTPLSVWRSKVEPEEDKDNKFMATGRRLEQFIAKWYADENRLGFAPKQLRGRAAKPTVYPPNKELIASESNKIFLASCDYFVGNYGVLECKNTSKNVEDVDYAHFCQGQWYLGVTGRENLTVAYAILPKTFSYDKFLSKEWQDYDVLRTVMEYKQFESEADLDLIKFMQEEADKFWRDHVLTKKPPEPINEDDVKYLYPSSREGHKIELQPSLLPLVEQITEAKEALDRAEENYEKLKGSMIAVMKDAEVAEYNGAVIATYKSTKESETFDSARFKKEHPELVEQYLKVKKGYRRFLLKD